MLSLQSIKKRQKNFAWYITTVFQLRKKTHEAYKNQYLNVRTILFLASFSFKLYNLALTISFQILWIPTQNTTYIFSLLRINYFWLRSKWLTYGFPFWKFNFWKQLAFSHLPSDYLPQRWFHLPLPCLVGQPAHKEL